MKKIIFLLIMVAVVIFPYATNAHGEVGSQTLDVVVDDLLIDYNKNSISDIDCEKIIDNDFERVGEALMSYMHPDQDEHDSIDSIMGGEGSESLFEMHRFMGKRYIGCDSGSFGSMMMFDNDNGFIGMQGGMMGMSFNDMSGTQSSFFTHMTGVNYFWFGLFHIVILILVIFGIIWLFSLINKKK